jgi:hypothetical protein
VFRFVLSSINAINGTSRIALNAAKAHFRVFFTRDPNASGRDRHVVAVSINDYFTAAHIAHIRHLRTPVDWLIYSSVAYSPVYRNLTPRFKYAGCVGAKTAGDPPFFALVSRSVPVLAVNRGW